MRCLSPYILAALLAFPCVVSAQDGVIIEFPQKGDTVSGVFVIRGIDCNGTISRYSFDDSPNTLQLATGLDRGDAAEFCNGNINVGFAGLFNAGLLSLGQHTIHFRDDTGNIVASRSMNDAGNIGTSQVLSRSLVISPTFDVVNFGEEFKTMVNPVAIIMQNQPMDDMTTELRFSVPAQGYQVAAVRMADDPNPSGSELFSLFQSRPFTLTLTNPDASTETFNYLFTRPATSTSGFPVIADDTPNTNSAAIANSIKGFFGPDIPWGPPYPYNLLDFDNCLYASLAAPTQTITRTSITGSVLRGRRNDAGQCAAFPFLNVVDAKPAQGEIGPSPAP
jgi:hypothetical protein